jgi:hypothetical protein
LFAEARAKETKQIKPSESDDGAGVRKTWPRLERLGQVGPEVGPTSAFYSCIPTGMQGQTCSF